MEQKPPQTESDGYDTVPSKPKNVPSNLWEKFRALEKRTNEVTKKSTEKRIKQLQKQVLDAVTQEFTSPEDKTILENCDIKLSSQAGMNKSGSKRKADDNSSSSQSVDTKLHSSATELQEFLNVNEHLQQKDYSRPPPPTALEKKINEAIRAGDFKKAESLSDHLATREMGERIVSAIEAKRFMEQKKVEEATVKAKKRRKLIWGFEPKHRWETKGNM